MIRVLHILDSMNRGGIETTLMNIFRKIDKDKVVFDFLLQTDKKCDYSDEIEELGGKIYSVIPRKKGILKNKKELESFFATHKEYKIVHMHVGSLTYTMPLRIAKKYSVPIRIIHSRNTREGGHKIHKYMHLFNKIFIGNIATDFFACSDLAGKWLYPKKIINSSKYKIINNGIATEKFIYSEDVRKKIRKELKCENKLILVNVGRLHPQKNHMFLLEIFGELIKVNKQSMMYLIGDGKLRADIENKIKQMNLEKNIILLGKRENIYDLLQGMDIFVMPSFYEGLPGSVIEAQGAGLPCVISDTITKEVEITDLVNYLSINENPKVWSEKILEVVKTSKRRNTQREIKNACFDMEQIANDLQVYYLNCIGECK